MKIADDHNSQQSEQRALERIILDVVEALIPDVDHVGDHWLGGRQRPAIAYARCQYVIAAYFTKSNQWTRWSKVVGAAA